MPSSPPSPTGPLVGPWPTEPNVMTKETGSKGTASVEKYISSGRSLKLNRYGQVFMLIEMVSISVLDWITAFTPAGFSNSCLRPRPPLLCRDRSLKGVTSLDISDTAVSLQVRYFVISSCDLLKT